MPGVQGPFGPKGPSRIPRRKTLKVSSRVISGRKLKKWHTGGIVSIRKGKSKIQILVA